VYMKDIVSSFLFLFLFIGLVNNAYAHFGVIMPSTDVVDKKEGAHLILQLQFMHPYDYEFMDLERPEQFGVVVEGKRYELTKDLEPHAIQSHKTWQASYDIKMPGDHIFFMVPKPYWEPAEGSYIQHFTKVIVSSFGLETGWDRPIGLKTEIVPLTRPYGVWRGNLFCGQVLLDGKAAPHTMVEVEFYNKKGQLHAPSAVFATQTLVTDNNGCFCYAIPRAGWWGFAGLNTISGGMKRNGRPVDLELGAVIWVHAAEVE